MLTFLVMVACVYAVGMAVILAWWYVKKKRTEKLKIKSPLGGDVYLNCVQKGNQLICDLGSIQKSGDMQKQGSL